MELVPIDKNIEFDEIAREIVDLLRKNPNGLHFNEIQRRLKKPRATINKRLKELVRSGILEKRRVGNKVIYTISNKERFLIYATTIDKYTIDKYLQDLSTLILHALTLNHVQEARILLCHFLDMIKLHTAWLLNTLARTVKNMIEENVQAFRYPGETFTKVSYFIVTVLSRYYPHLNYPLSYFLSGFALAYMVMIPEQSKLFERWNELYRSIDECQNITCKDVVNAIKFMVNKTKREEWFKSLLEVYSDVEKIEPSIFEKILKIYSKNKESILNQVKIYD